MLIAHTIAHVWLMEAYTTAVPESWVNFGIIAKLRPRDIATLTLNFIR